MAIRKSFGGQTILKPGAYSQSRVDNTGGSAIESNDTILLVGESSRGAPGDNEGIQEFNASQISQLAAKYGSGPLVDCALSLRTPSLTPGIGGAGRVLVWKTNSSTQASLTLENSVPEDLIILKDRAWGASGNDLSVTVSAGSSANQKLITVERLNSTAEVLGENAALAVFSIEYTGDATTASAAIAGISKAAKSLDITLAGDQTDGSADLSVALASYDMKGLADFINSQNGYSASLVTGQYAALSATELDPVSSVDVTSAQNFFRLQEELVALINQESDRVSAELDATPVEGLPANVSAAFLTGGAKGASTNADFSDGFAQSLAEDYNVLLPCVSRDASDDIADAVGGFTDAASTYTIASILVAADSHLRLRGSIKNRKEAQGFCGFRAAAKADVYAQAQSLNSELMQLCMQDVLVLDSNSNLTWKQPHVMAALMAGIRLGTEVGEPLTHKVIAARAVGHFVDALTGLEDGDFNSNLDSVQAIEAGVTFTEKAGVSNRIVVDNTTYGIDESFVFNRGSVVEAAQFVAKDLRQLAEQVFIGQKVSNGVARSIKSVLRARLIELNNDTVNIITSSADAPQGFVEETFTVNVTGNTAEVSVEVKPVQGLDFLFISFLLGDIQQSA